MRCARLLLWRKCQNRSLFLFMTIESSQSGLSRLHVSAYLQEKQAAVAEIRHLAANGSVDAQKG